MAGVGHVFTNDHVHSFLSSVRATIKKQRDGAG